jgi:hypothetical protein
VGMNAVAFRMIGLACWLLSPRASRQPIWCHDLGKIGRTFYTAAVKELAEAAV